MLFFRNQHLLFFWRFDRKKIPARKVTILPNIIYHVKAIVGRGMPRQSKIAENGIGGPLSKQHGYKT